MKLYIAGSRHDRIMIADLMHAAEKAGHVVTVNWTKFFEHSRTDIDAGIIAAEDLRGVRECDMLIGVLPGGPGTNFELGYGYALEKKIVLFAPDSEIIKDNIFYCQSNVNWRLYTRPLRGADRRSTLIDEALNYLDQQIKNRSGK